MGDSNIEWIDKTWNPIVGCSIVSPGCTHCYAMRTAARMNANPATPHYHGTVKDSKAGPVWTGKVAQASEATLLAPLRWKKPRRIFVNSMGDLFHESIPDEWIDRVFAVMALCPQHTFQVLTKRAERMREYVSQGGSGRFGHIWRAQFEVKPAYGHAGYDWPLPNVWLGVSCERQQEADERIPHLLQTPAAIRFVSAEPLLGPIDFTFIRHRKNPPAHIPNAHIDSLKGYCDNGADTKLNWIIVGGESGSKARPMHPDWARSIRDQCAAASVAFFFKQWGAFRPDRILTDAIWEDGPASARYLAGDFARLHGPLANTSQMMRRVGKKSAGRLIDGREHSVFPVIEGRESQPGLSSPDSKSEQEATA